MLRNIRRALAWYLGLKKSERVLVGAVIVVGGIYFLMLPVQLFRDLIDDNARLIDVRTRNLTEVTERIHRYNKLEKRLRSIQDVFSQSQMTFEQVTAQLDKIVRESIGTDNYDLKKTSDATPMGLSFEKQEFNLNVKSLTLEQLVKLLHSVENGSSPLFLAKVDVSQVGSSNDFGAKLEIFSIRKSKA